MKIKKVVSGVLVLAALVTSTVVATAADVIETKEEKNRNMSTAYSKTTKNKVGYMYYHVGSINWYDDVFAYTQTNVAAGMEGYATVSLDALDGSHAQRTSYTVIDNSYVITDNAGVSGQDYAKWVIFTGARREKGQTDWTGFNYKID